MSQQPYNVTIDSRFSLWMTRTKHQHICYRYTELLIVSAGDDIMIIDYFAKVIETSPTTK